MSAPASIGAMLLPCLALLASACGPAAGQGTARGPVMFADNCAPCHGGAGTGDASIEAPAIAGLPQWYVEAQVTKFRDGLRGAHADDYAGLRMRPMSRTIPAADVPIVSAYVAGLPVGKPSRAAVHGDAAKGKTNYMTCSACHGVDGKGNEALNAPPLVQLDDWYMKSQIHKFKAGIRGSTPGDTTGAQMRPMAATLADDTAVQDVIAYIGTL
jgi:cytochrome c553